MQPKTVHNLSLIYNDFKITSIATCFRPTWPSSDNCSLFETFRVALDRKSVYFHAVAYRCSRKNVVV
jgi:hypothetical protein